MSVTRWIVAVVGLVLVQSVVTTNITGQTTQPRQFDYDVYWISGPGLADCGSMTSDLRKDRGRWEYLYTFYAQGFLTGANMRSLATRQGNPKVGEGTSPEALLAAMEQYCGQHPLEKVAEGLVSVYSQLAVR